MQQTIQKQVEIKGTALHNGKPSRMVFLPAPPGTGILFRRVDLPGKPRIPARVDYFKELPIMCSCVGNENGAMVRIIEHLMACLNAFRIDNLMIEIDNEEIPFMEGDAAFLLRLVKEAGIKVQNAPREPVRIKAPIVFKENGVEMTACPSDVLRVTFFASYPNPHVGSQSLTLEVTPESFASEIAAARTFCFESDVEEMLRHGLLRGATENSALVYGEKGLLNGSLRFPDEPVRHKIMDLIGDLYLLGAPLLAHVTAFRSGHIAHARFIKFLRKEAGL